MDIINATTATLYNVGSTLLNAMGVRNRPNIPNYSPQPYTPSNNVMPQTQAGITTQAQLAPSQITGIKFNSATLSNELELQRVKNEKAMGVLQHDGLVSNRKSAAQVMYTEYNNMHRPQQIEMAKRQQMNSLPMPTTPIKFNA